ncbi:MAG: hypothetical protein OEL78_00355 [Hyphomicrobiales bacterium]|nr:hypothetical protein [Hyphomicrobiales bacterium]
MTGRAIIFAALLLAVAACQSVPVHGDFCYRNGPVRLSETVIDQMSDADVERVIAINERGQHLCGWKP